MASILKVDTIQDQDGNNIINESSDTITIGASGDTITIPSGASMSGFNSTGIDDNATSTAITIDSSENVGIGESSPDDRLHVNSGSQNDVAKFESTDTTASLILVDSATTTDGNKIQTIGDTMNFQTGGTEAMRINASQQIGIGTTSPANNLHIHTDANGEGILVKSTGNTYNDIIGNANRTGAGTGIIRLRGEWNGNSVAIIGLSTGDDTSNKDDGRILFSTSSSGSSPNERMRIEPDGKVGIGTSSPSANLEVRGSSSNGQIYLGGSTTATYSQIYSDNDGVLIASADGGDNASGSSFRVLVDGSEAMRVTNGLNVGIGTSSPGALLHIKPSSGNSVFRIESANTSECMIEFADPEDTNVGRIRYAHSDNHMQFVTNASEAMRIASNGDAYFNKTSDAFASTIGIGLLNTGQAQFVAANQGLLYCNRLSSDGQLAIFFQDNTEEGSINVSGSTVSYNGFTGTHWSRFQDNSTPTILRGTVLETLDEMCDWYNLEFDVVTQDEDGNDITSSQKIPHVLADGQSNGDTVTYNHKGTDYQATIVKEDDIKHMMSKVSDTVDAKNVYGVFVAHDLDGEGYNDFYVASVGSFVVRIKANETIAKGDLLQSNGDGTAKVQSDDNIKSSSFAKVLSTTIIETYEDGSYLVPCSLMC